MCVNALSVFLHVACARGIKKSLAFASQSAPSPSTVKESQFVPLPPIVTKKISTVLKPVSKAEEVLEIPVYLKENYSFNWWIFLTEHANNFFFLSKVNWCISDLHKISALISKHLRAVFVPKQSFLFVGFLFWIFLDVLLL